MSRYFRKSKNRIPQKVFIFTEGSQTEQRHFKEFIEYFRISQAKVEVIQRDKERQSRSSPSSVIASVMEFKKALKKNEPEIFRQCSYWLVMDTDRWEENLMETIKEAYQNNYELAISKPCFEIWLLLHYRKAKGIKDCETELQYKPQINATLYQFNLSGRNERDCFPKTNEAIENAKALDIKMEERHLRQVGSRVCRLIELMQQYV